MAFITYYCYSVSLLAGGGGSGLDSGNGITSSGLSVLSGFLGVSVSGFRDAVSIGGLGRGGKNLQVIGADDFGGGGGLLDITTLN